MSTKGARGAKGTKSTVSATTGQPVPVHICPHGRKNPTGMEVCPTCGDVRHCTLCGDEYIYRDLRGALCYPCLVVERMRRSLALAMREQQRRIAKSQVAMAGQP